MKKIIIWIVVLIVVAGGSFYGGMKYQASKKPSAASFGQFRNGAGVNARTGQAVGAGAIMGQVLSIDNQSMTVQMRDGSSKVVILSSSTGVSKQASGAIGDVKIGNEVSVIGTTNTDGSVTAQTIQIRPNIPSPSPSPTK